MTEKAAQATTQVEEPAKAAAPQPARRGWLARLQGLKGALVAVAGVGAVLSGLIGYWTSYQAVKHGMSAGAAAAPVALAPSATDAGPLSLVVLPLANLTGDAAQAYIADGMTASITTDLSRIRDAYVVSAAKAFAYKDKALPPAQVGRELGVRFVLSGSVQRSSEQLRVNIQLADAGGGAQLLSQSFDGSTGDLFALQDRVTHEVGSRMGREMVIVAARDSEKRKASPKVADLMLRARALGFKPRTAELNRERESLYRQVLALDPDNVRAMLGLSGVIAVDLGAYARDADDAIRERRGEEGKQLLQRARALAPDDPGVYELIAAYTPTDDYDGYRVAAQTRLNLQPKDPNAYWHLANSYLLSGEPARAIELLTQAVNLDPKEPSTGLLAGLCRGYHMLGDAHRAIEWCQRTLQSNAASTGARALLAMAYLEAGDEAKARETADEVRRADPGYVKSFMAFYQPTRSTPQAYRDHWEKRLLPAARKLGLAV